MAALRPHRGRRFRLDLPRGRVLELEAGTPQVMGIVNITPDSFSDGGRFLDPERAVAYAMRLLTEGADILDLGAESTRPGGGVYGAGARPVPVAEEIDRLLPVLEALRRETDAVVSVDTRKGAVARAALEAGADLINDVGGLSDPELAATVAEHGCPVIVMHSRGDLPDMQQEIAFDDVARDVATELADRRSIAARAGIAGSQIILDPGIGFGKTVEQNLDLICHLDPLHRLGLPVLVGASRKSFISAVCEAAPESRLGGSLAAAAWACRRGAAILRVHDVQATAQFLGIWHALGRRDSAVQ